MTNLTDKTFLITGASGNVGRAIAHTFAKAGAKLALVDVNTDALNTLIAEIDGDSSRYRAFNVDLGNPEAIDTLLADMGAIDGLVHTVGGFAMGDPVHATKLDVFDRMMTLNARIVYLLAGKVASHMIAKGVKGSISIMLARSGGKGAKNQAAYTASKAAATRIMESMALELKEHGIRVNGVSPSIIDTPQNRSSMPNTPPDNWVSPAQIGDLMMFLATNDAMTGANIEISAWS
ncbi:MAG: SDR family NAD(P)-dependent oxidoreductase [Phototrophicales bacterium]|nr:SDR family NAD(P)-dependent oxidoreductase [Phototrophicales bacterium]